LSSVKQLFSKHWQLMVFVLGLIIVFWVIWALRSVLLPFVLGFILAYLMLRLSGGLRSTLFGHNEKPWVTQFKPGLPLSSYLSTVSDNYRPGNILYYYNRGESFR